MACANNPLELQDPALERLLSLREVVMETWQREVRARVPGASNPQGPAMGRRMHALFDEIARALLGSRSGTAQDGSSGAASDSRPNLAPPTDILPGAGHARVGADQIAQEFHVFKEALAACAGQS